MSCPGSSEVPDALYSKKKRNPDVKIIGLSEYAYGYNTDAMEKAGAVGVYQKSNAFEEKSRRLEISLILRFLCALSCA